MSPAHHQPSCSRETRRMTLQRHFKRMLIDVRDGVHLLHIGEMEIWDGADLALLREGLFKLIEHERCRSIVIDMSYVKYIPSGFFGMLFDWQEKRNVSFALTSPQPNVQRMLWFRRFFRGTADGLYELRTESQEAMVPTTISVASCLTEAAI
jgi:anti-anti-sigma factor